MAGDLVTGLTMDVSSGARQAGIGETITVAPGPPTTVTIRFRDPDAPNHAGLNPRVARVDLIAGDVRRPLINRHAAINETARVIAGLVPGHGNEQMAVRLTNTKS